MKDAGTITLNIRRILSRQDTIIANAYDSYARELYRYGLAITGSCEDADDVVQEVFFKLSRARLPIFDMKSYLIKAARNTSLSILRRRQRKPALSAEAMEQEGYTDDSSTILTIRRALSSLPLEQRETVILKLVSGFTFEEIARSHGISVNTAASRYRYGIAKMKHLLEEDDHE